MYSTYIFDLDGTLLNTLDDLASSTNYALKCWDMPARSTDEIRNFVGNGIRKLIERAVPGGAENPLFGDVLHTFQQHYLVHSMDTTRPYPGVPGMLASLRSRGCRVAVVSNKFDVATKELCRHFFPDSVEVAIGENEAAGILKKPAPDTVFKALQSLGAAKKDAVYVGDSDVDLMTARNAGLPCISVLWGFRDKDFLLEHGASCLVSKPSQLPAVGVGE